MDNNEIVVRNAAGVELGGPNARLNITVNGQNGDYPDALRYDMTDGDVKQVATEAVRTGYIPGVAAAEVNFQDFVVDRFPATNELPPRLMLRPKTPFGYQRCPRCKDGLGSEKDGLCGPCFLEVYGWGR